MKKSLICILTLVLALVLCLGITSCQNESGPVKVTYHLMDGSDLVSWFIVDTDGSFTFQPLTRDGYIFGGLYDSPEDGVQVIDKDGKALVGLKRDTTLYVRWEPLPYDVTFDPGEGELVSSAPESFASGEELIALPVADRVGYEFTGWYQGEVQVTDGTGLVLEDMKIFTLDKYTLSDEGVVELTAKWTLRQITVTFDYNDGSFRTETVTLDYGSTLSLSDFPHIDLADETKETKGWAYARNTATLVEEDLDELTEDVTVYAVWRHYRVFTFVETDTKTEHVKVYADGGESLYTPVRPGYDFDGWYTSTTFSGNPVRSITYSSTHDTYYARWFLATYTVILNYGSQGGNKIETFTYNTENGLTLPSLTSTSSYIFTGWYENPSRKGAGMFKLNPGNHGDKILYAGWYNSSSVTLGSRWSKTWDTKSKSGTIEQLSNALTIQIPEELKCYADQGKLVLTVTATFKVGVQSMGNATGYATAYLICNGSSIYAVQKGQKGGGYGGFLWTQPQTGSWGYATGSVTKELYVSSAVTLGYKYTMSSDKDNDSVVTYLYYECTSLTYQFKVVG